MMLGQEQLASGSLTRSAESSRYARPGGLKKQARVSILVSAALASRSFNQGGETYAILPYSEHLHPASGHMGDYTL